ncbi:MAG: 5-formyltetrahydrofolate cyclo-ligase [Candidatus Latescibacterota bacterium]
MALFKSLNLCVTPVYVKKYSPFALVPQMLDTRAAPIYYAAMQRAEHILDKNKIRQQALEQRKNFSPQSIATSSQIITDHVLNLSAYTRARCLHIYVSGKDNELDTLPLIEHSLHMGKEVAVPVIGKKVPTPHTAVKAHAMAHALIRHPDELNAEYWGIRQPDPCTAHWLSAWERIDLVVVPGIVFDRRGRRIGYGAGYYDRFLARFKALRVGLGYDALLCDELPTQEHDIPMDLVITETTTYQGDIP